MAPIKQRLNHFISRGGFGFLLAALLLLFLFYPLASRNEIFRQSLLILTYVSVLYGLKKAGYNRKFLYIFPLLAMLSVFFGHSYLSNTLSIPTLIFFSSTIFFFIFSSIFILNYVLKSSEISIDKIFAAICVYFLLGMIWSFLYALTDLFIPGSFIFTNLSQGQDHTAGFFIYYSFVTLTTLGYGDIIPTSDIAKSLAALEAFTGQLFLAVLIARLVGLHIAHSMNKN